MEKDYKKELFNISQLAKKYSKLGSAKELNIFLEKENYQRRDKFGTWRFNREFTHFEKFEEKQVGTYKKVYARKITWEGKFKILELLEERGLIKW